MVLRLRCASLRLRSKRETFGKRLVEPPVIRMKLAQMTRQVEATHNWVESITYQMATQHPAKQMEMLAGPIALLKAQCTQTFEYCAREAAQIFGGLAYTRGGQGEKIERLYREVRAYGELQPCDCAILTVLCPRAAIPGGSEEIMLDLGMRQALKGAIRARM